MSTCNLKKRQMKHITKELEVGCDGKIGRNIAAFVVYVPPSMRACEFSRLSKALSAEIAAVKAEHKNPSVIVAGDFNHRDAC